MVRARICALVAAAGISGALGASPVRAESLVVADAEAPAELRVEADAVAFLLRQALDSPLRPVTPIKRLREALRPGAAGRPLTATREEAAGLLSILGADRFVLWRLLADAEGKGLRASGVVLGPDARPLGRVTAEAARGEVAALARALAVAIGRHAPGPAAEIPAVGVAELRPFLDAQARSLDGDLPGAARSLEWAPAAVARLPHARALVVAAARAEQVPPALRVRLHTLAGEHEAGLRLADQAGASGDVELQTARARAQTAAGRLAEAERSLAALPAEPAPAVAAARAELAIARKAPPATVGALLAPALAASPGARSSPIMALVVSAPPAAVSAEVEAMTVAAARRMAVSEAALSGGERYLLTGVAMHALGSGDAAAARAAAPLVRAPELSEEQMSFAQARIEAMKLVDDPALQSVQQKMAEQAAASAAARAAATARAARVGSPLARALVQQLRELETPYQAHVASLGVADLAGGGSPAWAPFVPQPQVLREALAEAASLAPFELPAAPATQVVREEQLAEETRRELPATVGGDAVVLARARVDGLFPQVAVELAVVDPRRGTLERRTVVLPGRAHGLVELAGWVLPAAVASALVLLVLAGWLWRSYWRRGGVLVRAQWATDSREELFCIAITPTPEAPELGPVEEFRRSMSGKMGGQTAREAWRVGRTTEFRRLPAGRWYVSLYGIYTLGKQTIAINDDPEAVDVKPRKTTTVVFDLQHREAEFEIRVTDGKLPVAGARIWIDDRVDAVYETDASGKVLVKIEHGYRLINIAARDVEVRRAYHVIKAKRHEMNINLESERYREEVSRALERHGEEVYEKL